MISFFNLENRLRIIGRVLLAMVIWEFAAENMRAAWMAYDDHTRGSGTGTNVTTYNLRTKGGGSLVDQATGVVLPVELVVTNRGNPSAVRYGAMPLTNTPAWSVFNGFVDFYNSGSADNGSLIYAASNQLVALTFTNLNPSGRYSFRATSIRGGIDDGTAANDYHRRWTLCALTDASSFTEAHSTGCVTSISLPESGLLAGQAAYNGGMNRTNGDVIGWDDITPSAAGSFSVIQTQYLGPIGNGESADTTNGPGYAINGFRLEETTAGPIFGMNSPPNNASFLLPAQIVLSAAASGLTGIITNVAFFANGESLGDRTVAPFSLVWTNPLPATYRLTAVSWDSFGFARTSASVNINVSGSLKGPGKVYLVVGSDTAIWNDGSTVDVFARHPYYPADFYSTPGSPAFQVMDPLWRSQFRDSSAQPVKFTWWLMGGNIYREADNLNVPVPNTMVPYLMKKYHGEAMRRFGDELSLHYHTFIWSDYAGKGAFCWNQSQTFAECQEDFDFTLAQYLLEEEIFPVSFRSGWHYMDNDWQQYLDQLLPFSMDDNWPAYKAWDTTPPINNVQDWSRAPSTFVPYHPATNDYQIPGSSKGWNLRSIKMQNMASNDMNNIFASAYNGTDQVVCIWDHLPESFVPNFARIDSYAQGAAANYPAVKFSYCTAIEGMQRWMGVTNPRPPEIEVTEIPNGTNLTLSIRTSKPLFQPQPFVAVRDAFQQYSNVTALCLSGPASNSWTITLPVSRMQLAKVGVAATDLEGNLSTRILHYLPDDIYVDNLDLQYSEPQGDWISTAQSAWGVDARVAWLEAGETAQARWYLPIVRSGLYTLFAQVPTVVNAVSNVTWIIHAGAANIAATNFLSGSPAGQWTRIGTIWMDASATNYLEMTTHGNSDGGFALADVVKITPVADFQAWPPSQLAALLTNNELMLRFTGIPGFRCQWERSVDLSAWTPLSIFEISPLGISEYEETNPPPKEAFYRVIIK